LPPTKAGLVRIKTGWYYTAGLVDPDSNAQIHPRVWVDEEDQVLLLEKVGAKGGVTCWHALVDGTIILVWDDSFQERVDETV
jgi:hypothetical protein